MRAGPLGAGQPTLDGDLRPRTEECGDLDGLRIIRTTSSLVPRWRQMSAMVARASTLIGLNAMLPISLIQMSRRRSVSTGHFSPPAIITSENSLQREEIVPSGSPMENRVPSRWRTTPGSMISVAAYTTQPIARCTGSAALTAPSGSTLVMR